ncbi:MAG: iron complex outermembrane receptor protein [Bermanella sp.]|jgi:iron complex outermembrane receptor protein
MRRMPAFASLLLFAPTTLWAQSSTPNDRRQLEEVLVTAQMRSESLGDVPVSVTSIDADKLNEAGIENLSDLSEYTPNFKLVDSGLVPNVYMRGIGSGSNQGFELSVGIFSDGIHLGRAHQTRTAFMDVERVEVLRGPQSILFGKNAIAGAVSLISARPSDELAMRLTGTQGLGEDKNEFTGSLSGPISDSLGARIALRYRDEDGYVYNPEQDRDEPSAKEKSARLVLGWSPSDSLETHLKIEQTNRQQGGRTLQITHSSALTGCSGEDVERNDIRQTDARENDDLRAFNHSFNAEFHFGAGTLTSNTGWSGFDNTEHFDADSSTFDTAEFLSIEDYEQFSQELRFVSPGGQRIDYIAGLYYQRSELVFDESTPLKVRTAAVQDTGLCQLNTAVLVEADLEREYTLDTEASSAFFQLTLNLTETLRSTVGARYVSEQKEGYRRFDIFEPGSRNSANPLTTAVLGQLRINSHEMTGKRSSDLLLPLVNLQWDASDDIMTYISYTQGAKSGGYDARGNNNEDGPTGGRANFLFDDEQADAWELGTKMRLAGGTADLNIALYKVEYSEMQVSVFDGVAGFNVTNAGSALTQGIEIDSRWLATDWLLLTGAVAYLDFEWLDYKQGPCYPGSPKEDLNTGTCDLSGSVNQQTPEWTASLSGTITLPLGDNIKVEFTADANYRGEHFTAGDLDPRGLQESVTKYNARLRIAQINEDWSVALVGKNLSDELTLGIGAQTGLDVDGYRASTEPAKTVYLEAALQF